MNFSMRRRASSKIRFDRLLFTLHPFEVILDRQPRGIHYLANPLTGNLHVALNNERIGRYPGKTHLLVRGKRCFPLLFFLVHPWAGRDTYIQVCQYPFPKG
jgi:hypothetical protein